jgi:hypothetical protein
MSKQSVQDHYSTALHSGNTKTHNRNSYQFQSDELSKFFIRNGYTQLAGLLRETFSSSRGPVTRTLHVEELEMLEAELINQGILIPNVDTLSKRARHEISILLWHGKKVNIQSDLFDFRISIKDLIRHEIEKNCLPDFESTNSSMMQMKQKSRNELDYLEQFAGYLNGEFENPKSRYEKGLNVVLKAITKTCAPVSSDKIKCTLPLTRQEFISLVNDHTEIHDSLREF